MFAQSDDLCWLMSAPRDIDEELKEIRADVLWLYVASYSGIDPLVTLFIFFWRESKFKIYLECDLFRECKEITL